MLYLGTSDPSGAANLNSSANASVEKKNLSKLWLTEEQIRVTLLGCTKYVLPRILMGFVLESLTFIDL